MNGGHKPISISNCKQNKLSNNFLHVSMLNAVDCKLVIGVAQVNVVVL